MPVFCAILAAAIAAAAPAPASTSPLQVASSVAVERPVAAADGTSRLVATPGRRARPGDRLVVTLAYRNAGSRPIADLVLADPVPPALAYRGTAAGSPEPDLSVDGQRFATLADLRVALPTGGSRAAGLDDVVAVRWRLPAALPPGGGGTLAFRAVLK